LKARKVVVTGLGVVSPNGTGLKKFWENTVAGVSGLETYEWGRRFGFKSSAMGKVKDFVPSLFGVPSGDRAMHGRYLQFAIAASEMAVQDARLDTAGLDPARFGVSVSSAIADASSMEENLLLLTRGCRGIAPLWMDRRLRENLDFGLAASRIARRFGAMGGVSNLSTGCTAGVDAVGFGMDQIRSGRQDVMLVGASEAPLCPLAVGSFEALGALSTRQCGNAIEASCPYSAERDGFVLAEGCGMLVLESSEHALQRGARIYAELAGYASVNNAFHMTDLHSEGLDLARCIRLALASSGCPLDEVDHVSGHGSSTPQNDRNETAAIKAVFGDRAREITVNSLKSMTGHALAAANTIETVALCLEIQNEILHPTINYLTPDPSCDLDYVPQEARRAAIRSAVKLSSGFSGIHSALVLSAVEQ